MNEKLQEIEIFDKLGLFSNGRLRDEDVPEGLYRYDLRGSDYDPGQPITVEKKCGGEPRGICSDGRRT